MPGVEDEPDGIYYPHATHKTDGELDEATLAGLLAGTAEADALLEKCGAKNLRLIAGLAAGEGSGSIVSTWEADDFEAFGKVSQAFFRTVAPRSWKA